MIESGIDVGNLSSRRLWELMRMSELENVTLEQKLLERVKRQLEERNEYHHLARWQEPH